MPRKYEPFALTKLERRDKARVMKKGGCRITPRSRFCRLVRCIRKVEPRRGVRSAVAVCRASIYGKKVKYPEGLRQVPNT